MHSNKTFRSGVDAEKAAEAAIAQVRTGDIAQAGVGGLNTATASLKPSWARRLISKLSHRLLPLIKPTLSRYREYMNRPVLDRLIQIEKQISTITQSDEIRSNSSSQLLQRLDRIESYALAAARRATVNCGDGRILVRSTVGYVMCSTQDTMLLACLTDTGELEKGTRLLIERIMKPGGTFIDVGANIGLHTLAAARAMHGVGKVVAFEPFASTRALFTESVFINGFSDIVEIHEAAVSSRSGICKLHLGKTSGHHSLYSLDESANAEQKVVDVPLLQLTDVIPLDDRIDLIKIDVEGAELDVLESAKLYIEANSEIALIVEFGPSHLARTGCSVADWFDAFSALGLIYRAIDPLTGSMNISTPEQLSLSESTNLLFARPESSVWTRACATN